MAPRPSFWPYYLAPAKDGVATDDRVLDYSHPGARLAGWKRYPVRGRLAAFPESDSETTASQMNFLKASPERPIVFRGPIRFHNLHPIEFGGLLFAITLGERVANTAAGRRRHAIGRARAQGYGRASARVASFSNVERNDGAKLEALDRYLERFEEWLIAAWNAAQPHRQVGRVAEIPPVADLLAMADPEIGASVDDRLIYPTNDKLKSENETPSLAGYRVVKAAATVLAGDPMRRGRRVLPPYPHTPRSKPKA